MILNDMPYEEFQMIADIPMEQETPKHMAAEMRFAKNTQLSDIKRGIFMDRVAIIGGVDNTITDFINLDMILR